MLVKYMHSTWAIFSAQSTRRTDEGSDIVVVRYLSLQKALAVILCPAFPSAIILAVWGNCRLVWRSMGVIAWKASNTALWQ
jgi:hypothetical protein